MVNMCCSILMENLQCVLKQLLKYGEGGHKGLIVWTVLLHLTKITSVINGYKFGISKLSEYNAFLVLLAK